MIVKIVCENLVYLKHNLLYDKSNSYTHLSSGFAWHNSYFSVTILQLSRKQAVSSTANISIILLQYNILDRVCKRKIQVKMYC